MLENAGSQGPAGPSRRDRQPGSVCLDQLYLAPARSDQFALEDLERSERVVEGEHVEEQRQPPRAWTAPVDPRWPDPALSRLLARRWGQVVSGLRLERSLSQAELAGLCGVTQQTISKIERGLMVPVDPLKLRLSVALAVPPAEVFGWPPVVAV